MPMPGTNAAFSVMSLHDIAEPRPPLWVISARNWSLGGPMAFPQHGLMWIVASMR